MPIPTPQKSPQRITSLQDRPISSTAPNANDGLVWTGAVWAPAAVVLEGDARLTDARAPTGAAGGDLAGTYPNPTVTHARGLRESGGTSLAMGAVADGQFLKRVGSELVGAEAGGGGGGYDVLRRPGSWYAPLGIGAGTGGGANANQIRAMKFWIGSQLPNQLSVVVSTAGGVGARCRLGVFTMRSDIEWPDALVSGTDAGEINCESTGTKTIAISPSGMTTNAWHWLASLDNDTNIFWRLVSSSVNDSYAIGGGQPYIGAAATQAYGPMPSTFPSGALTIGASLFPVVYAHFGS